MSAIPTDRSPESTLAFLRAGYRFVGDRCDRYGTDIFQTRLLLEPTICLRGRPAAELFYDNDRFIRHGAMPMRGQRTLTGVGGVQGLDGDAHRARKAMLMSIMTPAGIRHLGQLFDDEWRARIPAWAEHGPVVLYDEVARILIRAVCAWAGVPLADADVARRTNELHAMIEAPTAFGPRHWRGVLARRRAERWIANLVGRVRTGALPAPEGSALRVIAGHRDEQGRPLPGRIAAVEVLNILRPTVAIDRFVVFAALALHDHPDWRDRVRGDDTATGNFVQEVRRYYPFFPVAAARVRRSFEWRGYPFPQGRRVLLDLYATNHHPELWPEPERFRPERFAGWPGDAFSLVPQGGGDHFTGHRCAGEWITIELMKRAVANLTGAMSYQVPPQNLALDLGRMPALPPSGLLIDAVRRTG
ncbi:MULTISPECIES: cytochrome P450 [Micromonospora]|uniref:Cytochrome P450 n=1 Tax=Micromonospora solifontis TaxID=2487138 RepID=A0ABX9WHT9_9ACTN|nr:MULTISPECIES: cytochrome P450 [Micromonospora]NES12437.1 cytochrome P450 [Micromonospora sp. PPF5-17B]NES36353.1 cytochrome P450 [Micromonospora solifontis]NES57801.1 cytochrome P450 [Micromonospora sp. PPF5-6]RNL99594.1 cytochrome P450 [Micromonospora solifontis]